MNKAKSISRTALVVAHPGHEMCVYGWLEEIRPLIFILTDGSGGAGGQSRLTSTTQLLVDTGTQNGCIFGRYTEQEIYSAILNLDNNFFISLVNELAEALVKEQIERVVGDAAEGYNSTHDIWRFIINAAVEIAQQLSSHQIANYDFPVVGEQGSCPDGLREEAIWVHLNENAFRRKIIAAQKYYPELLAEVQAASKGAGIGPLHTYFKDNDLANSTNYLAIKSKDGIYDGLDMFRVECLRPVHSQMRNKDLAGGFETPPFYEQHGQEQVVAGRYHQRIGYQSHVIPIAQSLQRYVESKH